MDSAARQRGIECLMGGKPLEAMEIFKVLVVGNPNDPWINYYLSLSHYNNFDRVTAEKFMLDAAAHVGTDAQCLRQITEMSDRILCNRMMDSVHNHATLVRLDPGNETEWQSLLLMISVISRLLSATNFSPDFRSRIWDLLLTTQASTALLRARHMIAQEGGIDAKPPKIFDCVLINNELDMLELRLNTVAEHVDYVVLVEAPCTFTKQPKPLYYAENKARFAAFEHKIIYVVCDNPPDDASPWDINNAQRDATMQGLQSAMPWDIVLISDLDEIPRPEYLPLLRQTPPTDICGFTMATYFYFLDIFHPECPWVSPVALPYGFLKYIAPSLTRYLTRTGGFAFRNAGWHFTYMGGVDKVIEKLGAGAHEECASEDAKKPENVLAAMFNFCSTLNHVVVDESYPLYIRNNLEKYREMGWLYPGHAHYDGPGPKKGA